jgi:hypothetical protein
MHNIAYNIKIGKLNLKFMILFYITYMYMYVSCMLPFQYNAVVGWGFQGYLQGRGILLSSLILKKGGGVHLYFWFWKMGSSFKMRDLPDTHTL